MIRPLNRLSKKDVPFKWIKQWQKKTSSKSSRQTTFIYPDPDTQNYLFMDSSKHSWSGIFVQHIEQSREDGTKLKVLKPITYQSGTFQGSQKKAYAIYVSSQYGILVMVRCDHAPLQKLYTH